CLDIHVRKYNMLKISSLLKERLLLQNSNQTGSYQKINIITLILTHFLWGFVNFIYLIQIQPFLIDIYGTSHETAQILGLILSLGTFSAVIPLLIGFLADFFGRKNLIVFGQILSIFGLIGLSSSPKGIFAVLISVITFNLGIGFYDPPLQTIISESAPKERQGVIYSVIYNSASIAGIIASFFIQIEVFGDLSIFFQIGYLLLGIATIINLFVLHDILPKRKKMNFPLIKVFKHPVSRLTAIALALDAFCWGLPFSIANGIYIILFDVDVAFIARLILVQTIFQVLLQYPAGLTIDRFGRIFGLIIGELTGIMWILLIVVAIATPTNAPEILIFSYALIGISGAFWFPSVTLAKISIDTSVTASANFGTLSFIERLGWVPTAVISGVIFSLVGFIPLLFMTFVGTLIVITMIFQIDRIENEKRSENFLDFF
ncbi:MAG: MFS transporter, partial [Promethearchaeota archaeon]